MEGRPRQLKGIVTPNSRTKTMNAEQALVIYDTVRGSLTGEMTFGQIVGRLSEIGVERYHADYSRQEKTFYLANGDSLVLPIPWGSHPTGTEFSAAAVEAAVRQSQRGEHTYTDFVRKTMAAGCVGYFVQITGRRALYFGRNGETHVELFPPAPGK
jgi:uncharacterized protein YbcV (DUF1398 family)